MTVRTKPRKAGGKYQVFHWDTFDDETFQLGEFETLKQAEAFVEGKYNGRIGPSGADKVDIVFDGTIVRQYSVR